MLTFLYCLNLKNMADRQIHHINYNSKHHGKCKFGFKCIRFLTVSNLFTLEVVQKCQHCQLCVLQENSIRPSLSPKLFLSLSGFLGQRTYFLIEFVFLITTSLIYMIYIHYKWHSQLDLLLGNTQICKIIN